MSRSQGNVVRHFIEVEILDEEQQPTPLDEENRRPLWRVMLPSGAVILIFDADYQTITSRPK